MSVYVKTDPDDLRDKFAMAAINGCCLMSERITDPLAFCESAYEIADAMMEARKPK